MLDWIQRTFSMDDLWSAFGYFAVIAMSRLVNSSATYAVSSMLAAGMLAIFWSVAANVRARNAEHHPNARIVFWAVVALISALFALR